MIAPLVAVSKRVPGHVVGDGIHTIEQLVEEVNRDPRRGIGHEKVLTRLTFDHQAETMLARKGYTSESIPEAGERVFLRSTGNLSTGGTATDVTDVVHPDNVEMAVREGPRHGLLPEQEVKLYLVHGLLHLCGYDDHSAADSRRMRRRQAAILRNLETS